MAVVAQVQLTRVDTALLRYGGWFRGISSHRKRVRRPRWRRSVASTGI